MRTIDAIKPETNCSEILNNSDTIYRQDAIDALDKRFDSIPMELTTEILLLRKDLRNLQPAQPKIKTGNWIWCVGSHKCSNCEEYTCFNHKELLRYCPNCGAKMRGEDDGKSGCNHPVGEDKDSDHE